MERAYSDHPLRHEYRLTEKGMSLYPVLVTLSAWGDEYKQLTEPAITYTHESCGHECRPRLTCDCCGEPIDPRRVAAHASPDAFKRIPEKLR